MCKTEKNISKQYLLSFIIIKSSEIIRKKYLNKSFEKQFLIP